MHENDQAADDVDAIRKRLMYLRRVCFKAVGYTADAASCWCIGAGENGANIECVYAAQATAVDLAGKEAVEAAAVKS